MTSDNTTKTWIACRDCGVAHLLTSQPRGILPRDELDNAVTAFLDNHRGHTLTTLRATSDSPLVCDRPLWDPLTRVSVQASDGQTDYVVTSERPSLDQERRYRVRPGRLPPRLVQVGLVTDEAWTTLCENFAGWVEGNVLTQLFEAVRGLAASIPPTAVEPSFDDPNDPQVGYANWPEPYLVQLVELGRRWLPPSCRAAWNSFVREHTAAHGALGLCIRFQSPGRGPRVEVPAPL